MAYVSCSMLSERCGPGDPGTPPSCLRHSISCAVTSTACGTFPLVRHASTRARATSRAVGSAPHSPPRTCSHSSQSFHGTTRVAWCAAMVATLVRQTLWRVRLLLEQSFAFSGFYVVSLTRRAGPSTQDGVRVRHARLLE